MPEIAEVALMVNAIRDIMNGKKLKSIDILGGRYKVYKIKNQQDQWISHLLNEKTGKKQLIDPKQYPGGQHFLELNGYPELIKLLPLSVQSINVRGKFCWIELTDNWYIGITFGMT